MYAYKLLLFIRFYYLTFAYRIRSILRNYLPNIIIANDCLLRYCNPYNNVQHLNTLKDTLKHRLFNV